MSRYFKGAMICLGILMAIDRNTRKDQRSGRYGA